MTEQELNNLAVKKRSKVAALRVYHFIVRYKAKHDGCPPSIRQIVTGVGLSSPSMASYYLASLEADRLIRRNDSRGIEVIGARWIAPGAAK